MTRRELLKGFLGLLAISLTGCGSDERTTTGINSICDFDAIVNFDAV